MRFVLSAVLVSAVAVAGCGSKDPQFAQNPMPSASVAPPPPPTPSATVAPPAAAAPCDAIQTQALTSMFTTRGPSEAPGAKADGTTVCGVVPEGQTYAGQSFMLEPGYCYTFLGQALPGVTDMDMELDIDPATIPPIAAPLFQGQNIRVAIDGGDVSPTSSIGAKGSCFTSPTAALGVPIMVKLVVKAHTGSGPVAAQVFRKKK